MSLQGLSKSVVWIPNMVNNHVRTQTKIEQVNEQIAKVFNNLKTIGVNYSLLVGGMSLDYAGYDIQPYLPSLLVMHTRVNGIEEIPELYEDTPLDQILRELAYVNNQVAFLPDIIYQEALNEAKKNFSECVYLLNPDEEDIEVDCSVLNKYYDTDLVLYWLKNVKILVMYDYQKQDKFFKRAFVGNKAGLKINITSTGTEYWLCGNPVRENYIFS